MSDEEYRNVPTCNVAVGTSAIPEGAKAYLIQNGWDRMQVLVRSRSGRWIRKWVAAKHLTNWRYKTVVPESSEYRHLEFYKGWDDRPLPTAPPVWVTPTAY